MVVVQEILQLSHVMDAIAYKKNYHQESIQANLELTLTVARTNHNFNPNWPFVDHNFVVATGQAVLRPLPGVHGIRKAGSSSTAGPGRNSMAAKFHSLLVCYKFSLVS